MRISPISVAAALALSLANAPVLARPAAPPSAAPLSIAGSVERGAPGDEDRPNQLAGRTGFLLPAVLILAFVAGIVIFSINGDPSSP